MRVVLAFDVDGTLWCGQPPGPVTVDWFSRACATPDTSVAIVSPSTARPQPVKGWVEINTYPDRVTNLQQTRRRFEADLYIYVSDNADNAASKAAGFVHVHPTDFRLPS